MPNPQNIIPPKKGEIRNPNGRGKGNRNRSTIVREWLNATKEAKNPISGQIERLEIADQIVIALIGKALKGDVNAFKELMDSGFGKIKETIEQVTKNDTKIVVSSDEAAEEIKKLKERFE